MSEQKDCDPQPIYELVPPNAGALVESLRGIGYSAATALADLIDNSISAGARNVWLSFNFNGSDSCITVLDDGRGMCEVELRRAMTLGGVGPGTERSNNDLGRFGLGLKTASFSQCRCLTVGSKREGAVYCRRWDLDYIARPDVRDWRLLSFPRTGAEGLLKLLDPLEHGTVVIWQGLDRIVGDALQTDTSAETAFYDLAARIEQHLAMVFHRYLEGQTASFRIFVGGNRVSPWDPFLRSHLATNSTPTESIYRPNGVVELQGFVLPHKDQMGPDYEAAGGTNGWTAQQGFYVYRSRRLLVAGGWLGLGSPRRWTMEEPFKLARLRLEFTNLADYEWDIDVKKSVARPPRWLRSRLTGLATKVRENARKVFAHRGAYGKREAVPDLVAAWTSRQIAGSTSYRINREHPAIQRAFEETSAENVEQALRIIEETVPVQRIWLDTVENGEAPREAFAGTPDPQVETLARNMLRHLMEKVGLDQDSAIARLRSTDPFQNFPLVIDRLAESLPQAG